MLSLISRIALAAALTTIGCASTNTHSIRPMESMLGSLPPGIKTLQPMLHQYTPAAITFYTLWDSARKLPRWHPNNVLFKISEYEPTQEQIKWANDHQVYVSVNCDLPIKHKEIQYIDCSFAQDKELRHLLEMPTIRGLILNVSPNEEYNKTNLRTLISSPHLMALNVYGSRFDDEDMQALTRASSLSALTISNTYVSERGLTLLKQMKQLRMLNIGQGPTGIECSRNEPCGEPPPAPALTKGTLDVLVQLPNLYALSIGYVDLQKDATITSLRRLKHLTHLRIDAPLSPERINQVLSLSSLRELEISLDGHDDFELVKNSSLEFLRLSTFWGRPIKQRDIHQLVSLQNLKGLDLYSAMLEDYSGEKEALRFLLSAHPLETIVPTALHLCPEIMQQRSHQACPY